MADKLIIQQINFNRTKASQLRKEWETKKIRGERQVQKLEGELKLDLDRIESQIKAFENKADILESIVKSGVEQKQ